MKSLGILIVEDDFSFALELEMLVKSIGYQVAGIADNAEDALLTLASNPVDLVLMDIDIQGDMDGLQLGQKIKNLDIPILYITTYSEDEYLKEAQKSSMIGYLVKPISKINLTTTINLAIASLAKADKENSPKALINEQAFLMDEFLFFKKNKLFHKVAKKDIVAIKAEREYVQIFTKNEKQFIARMPISKMENAFDKVQYMRIHRSFIIQLKAIDKIDLQSLTIYIGKLIIPVSRSNRKIFLDRINKLE